MNYMYCACRMIDDGESYVSLLNVCMHLSLMNAMYVCMLYIMYVYLFDSNVCMYKKPSGVRLGCHQLCYKLKKLSVLKEKGTVSN